MKKIFGIRFDDSYNLISLDVMCVDVFNISTNLYRVLVREVAYFKKDQYIPLNGCLNAIRFILDSTYFKFNDVKTDFRYSSAPSIGSPLSRQSLEILLYKIL